MRQLCATYARDPVSYDTGKKTFEFSSDLYGHESVKNALIQAQHAKCAFCESKFTHIAYGDVEHFRPKGGCHQAEAEPLLRPGYYWLAYDWANLFLSCTLCNQRFKKNLFPLKQATRRARNHQSDVGGEEPMLIDPGAEDPEAFIGFREEVPYAIKSDARGESTIDILGLRRPALAERRRDHLVTVKMLRVVAATNEPEAQEARDVLERLQRDTGEYASMVRAFMRLPFRGSQRASRKSAAVPKHGGTRGRRRPATRSRKRNSSR
jgi:uncharacterized protein (TIGR02646 family)